LSCSPHPVRMIPDITGAADGEDAGNVGGQRRAAEGEGYSTSGKT
jgi:hypothetical protein